MLAEITQRTRHPGQFFLQYRMLDELQVRVLRPGHSLGIPTALIRTIDLCRQLLIAVGKISTKVINEMIIFGGMPNDAEVLELATVRILVRNYGAQFRKNLVQN